MKPSISISNFQRAEFAPTVTNLFFIWRLALIVCLPVAQGWSQSSELLGDPSFELSTPNGTFPDSGFWQPAWLGQAGSVCTTTAGRSGNGLWEYTGASASDRWSGQFQQYAGSPGSVYRGSAWVRSPAGQPWLSGSRAL